MLTPKINLPRDQRALIKLYTQLDEQQRSTLLAFAEFLLGRKDSAESSLPPAPQWPKPKAITRPAEESVIAAIKRLSASYFMLDRSALLNETSTLMSAHIMQGREAKAVIDDLEALFAASYARQAETRK